MVSSLSLPRRRMRHDGGPNNHLRARGGDRERDYDDRSGLGKAHISRRGLRPPRKGSQAQGPQARAGQNVLCERAGVCGGDGGVRECTLLGAGAARVGPRGAAGSCAAREGVRAREQKRLQRRACHRRSGAAPRHALGEGEDGRAAGCAGDASDARGASEGAHGAVQPDPWCVGRVRDSGGAGGGGVAPARARGAGGRRERAE